LYNSLNFCLPAVVNRGSRLENKGNHLDLVRFAAFELDLRTGELRKSGRSVRLQPQPFKILARLISEPGRLVLREELQKEVWGEIAHVDYEHGLNFCIRQIRSALDDNAESPLFIETVPKRGYRFIAQLDPQAHEDEVESDGDSGSPVDLSRLAADDAFVETETAAPPELKSRRLLWVAASGSAFLIVGMLCLWLLIRQQLNATPKVLGYTQITRDGAVKVPAYCCTVLVSDRSRIYFSEVRSGQWGIGQVPEGGGDIETLRVGLHSPSVNDLSPSGTGLLITGWESISPAAPMDSPLWVAEPHDGSVRLVGDVRTHDAIRSGDGRKILYATRDALFECNADGSGSHLIMKTAGIPYRARWSSDRKLIRFTLYDARTGLHSLWEVRSDGANPHLLFPTGKSRNDECCGQWTLDGRYYLYQSAQNGQIQIWALPEGGGLFQSGISKPVQLTSGATSFLAPAVIDSRHLLVMGNKTRGELMRYDAVSKQFMTYLSGLSAEGLDFSRDGQWMVYVSYPDATLWRSRIDGSERRQIAPNDMSASLPRWSPNGNAVVFTGSKAGGSWKGYIVSAEGGSPEPLVAGDGPEFDTVWSADGTSLAYAESLSSPTSGIHLVDFETRLVTRLPGSDHLFSPRWSPDGRYLAALTTDSLNLLLFDFSKHRWRTLVGGKHISYPTWSRDTASITFRAIYEDATPFYRVRVRDGFVDRIASVSVPGSMALSVSGAWSGLAPDGVPLILRDTSMQEVYSLEVIWP